MTECNKQLECMYEYCNVHKISLVIVSALRLLNGLTAETVWAYCYYLLKTTFSLTPFSSLGCLHVRAYLLFLTLLKFIFLKPTDFMLTFSLLPFLRIMSFIISYLMKRVSLRQTYQFLGSENILK